MVKWPYLHHDKKAFLQCFIDILTHICYSVYVRYILYIIQPETCENFVFHCPFMLTKFVIHNNYCYNISAGEIRGKATREYDISINKYYSLMIFALSLDSSIFDPF